MNKAAKKGQYKIAIDYSLCGNCGACVAVCPESVLHLSAAGLEADNDDCTGCKYCIITCPSDSLSLVDKGERL